MHDFNGIIERKDPDSFKVVSLPKKISLLQSMLQVPFCVLNSSATRSGHFIVMKWVSKNSDGEEVKHSFKLRRCSGVPFPTTNHLKYLDIILCMFCQNWNSQGLLHFRFSDICRIAGVKNVAGNRKQIKLAIQRYRLNMTEWENSWGRRTDTISFCVIVGSSILDDDNNIKEKEETKNARNSREKQDWHSVLLDPKVVASLKEDRHKRIFLSDIFSQLSPGTLCVYRYLRVRMDASYAESRKKKNAGWFKVSTLKKVFNFKGDKTKFIVWLTERLKELYLKGLLESDFKYAPELQEKGFFLSPDQERLRVICTGNLVAIRGNTLEKKQRKQKNKALIVSNNGFNLDINNCPDEDILKLYFDYKVAGEFTKEVCASIDGILSNPILKLSAVSVIRAAIKDLHTKQGEKHDRRVKKLFQDLRQMCHDEKEAEHITQIWRKIPQDKKNEAFPHISDLQDLLDLLKKYEKPAA